MTAIGNYQEIVIGHCHEDMLKNFEYEILDNETDIGFTTGDIGIGSGYGYGLGVGRGCGNGQGSSFGHERLFDFDMPTSLVTPIEVHMEEAHG